MIDKQQVSRHFGRKAQSYDDYAVVQKQMAYRLQQLVQAAGEFEHILEIGCGTGFFTRLLAETYPKAKILATDIAPDMLKTAAVNLRSFSTIQYQQGDGENLQLTEKFDLIVSNAAFQWFHDYKRAFMQFDTLLLPGGYLLYTTFGEKTFYELHHSFEAARKLLGMEAVTHHGPKFIELESLKKIAWELQFSVDCREIYQEEYFPDVKTFLNTVKKIGANNAVRGENMMVSKKLLLTMMMQYERIFGCQARIPVTYHVIYGSHKKHDL